MKVISFAPSRVSLFGGGTDVEPYASQFGGLCISMAINLRQVIEIVDSPLPKKIYWDGDNHDFFDKFLIKHDLVKPMVFRHYYDGLIESGLGSSASAAVALVGAVYKYNGIDISYNDIAEKAWEYEVKDLGLFGGKQDQYAATFGGVNVFEFGSSVAVNPLSKGYLDKIFPYFCLFHTGVIRKDPKIQEGMKELTKEKIKSLNCLKSIAIDSIQPLADGDHKKVGELLMEAWECKKKSNNVTTTEIDSIYKFALDNGATGGKLLGSGGGGYMLFLVDPYKRNEFIKKMMEKNLNWVDFNIDWNGLDVRAF